LRKMFVHFLDILHRPKKKCMRQPLESYNPLQNRGSFTNASSAPAQNTQSCRPLQVTATIKAPDFLYFPIVEDRLDHEALDLVLEGTDLAHEVGGLVGGDAAADDSAADAAGAAESHLAGDVNLEEKVLEKFSCTSLSMRRRLT